MTDHKTTEESSVDREPVAYLWQHADTARKLVVMPNDVVTMDANWVAVGPLYLLRPEQEATPEGRQGCTRSHPHELMSPSCRVRTVIAEMRNLEAQGAEVTAHTIGGWADYLASVLDEPHNSEQARDAARWRYVSRFMRLGDVGDDQFCLGLVIDSEGLEDRVSAQATRLHHEKSVREWEDVNGPEDEPKTLPQVDLGSAVDAAIDADGRMPLGEVGK